MDQSHEWKIGSDWEERNPGTCPKTQRQKYYRDQMGVQEQVQSIWISDKEQSKISM